MPMRAPEPVANTTVVREAAEKRSEREPRLVHGGQIAADRLLLYLRGLNFPESQVLGLALRAMREAERHTAPGSESNPVAEAMQALLHLLGEEPGSAAHNFRCEPPRASQPLVHRSHMVPQELYPTKTMRHWSAAGRTSAWAKKAKNGAGVCA